MTVDLSAHLGTAKVAVTHIVEGADTAPAVETAQSSALRLSESPIFIEEK